MLRDMIDEYQRSRAIASFLSGASGVAVKVATIAAALSGLAASIKILAGV